MTLIKSILGIRETIGGSEGNRLGSLDNSRCLVVLEKCSKVQNPGQSIRTVLPLHADIHTLYGLAYDCPHLTRQDDCPLKAFEQFPFKQKVLWINGLSKDEKKSFWSITKFVQKTDRD
jgi:hypothetical protein